MKKTFRGFYSLNDEKIIKDVWNSKKTIFVFDTNCLLNLYRCEDKTRDDILDVMSKISEKIWLPFFVCLEYQKNRRDVITESIGNLNLIKKSLNQVVTSVTDSLSTGKVKKHLYNALSESVHSLRNDIKPLIDDFITSHIDTRINSKEEVNKRDIIREKIDTLVNDKCGLPPTAEWIDTVNNKGIERYKKLTPPGFMDASKPDKKYYYDLEFEEKYGDLYIWMEIIEKSKNENIENVIFICDDRKKDWWYETKGITHGALEALQTEIYTESGIKNFKLITQATFLHNAQEYLPNIKINSESLKEVQQISDSQNDLREMTLSNALNKAFHESLIVKPVGDDEASFNEKIKNKNTLGRNNIFDEDTIKYHDKSFIPIVELKKHQHLIEAYIHALGKSYGKIIHSKLNDSELTREYIEGIITLDNVLSNLNSEFSKCLLDKNNLIDDYVFVKSSLISKVNDTISDCVSLMVMIDKHF